MSFGKLLSGIGLAAGALMDYKNFKLQKETFDWEEGGSGKNMATGRTMRPREELQTLRLLVLIQFWLLVLPLSLVLQYVFRPRRCR